MSKKYPITPVAKPRMTQRDKWKVRPSVANYRAFCDAVRLYAVDFPEADAHIIFHVPMPRSWSKKKQLQMVGRPHQQTPDLDNYIKALCDAVYGQDCHLWDYRASKIWALEGWIEVKRRGD